MNEVLIISYNFPPLEDIAARRYGLMVEYMEKHGYRPLVLTTEAQGSLPVRLSESQIIRIGTQRQKTARIDHKNEVFKIPKFFELIKKIPGLSNWRMRSYDRSMFSWYNEVQNQSEYILSRLNSVKMIIASFSPATALWVGRYISRKTSIPWIADFRDLGALRRDGRNQLAWYIDRKIESFLVKDTAGIISVSDHFSKYLNRHYLKQAVTIYNGWDSNVLQNTEQYINTEQAKPPYLYHAGRFYPHRMSAVQMLFDALVEIPRLRLIIRSLGPVELENDIHNLISERNLKDRVDILGPCSPEQVARETESAFASVVFEGISIADDWSQGWLTGKFLELLPYSSPILSIARGDNEMGHILSVTEKGRLCSEVGQIKEFLNECFLDSSLRNSKKEAINSYSKEVQAEKLCKFINYILSQPKQKMDHRIN